MRQAVQAEQPLGVVLPTQETSVQRIPHVGPRRPRGLRRHLGEPGHHRRQGVDPTRARVARHDHRAVHHLRRSRVHQIASKLSPARHLVRRAQG